MRVMAIDYGTRRIGIAVSDAGRRICGETFTLTETDMERAAARITAEIHAREVDTLVLGLPKNMDGSEGSQAQMTRRFGERLQEASGITPIFWDERRSSVEAHAILRANGRKSRQHRSVVDAVAASLLLEGYLFSV